MDRWTIKYFSTSQKRAVAIPKIMNISRKRPSIDYPASTENTHQLTTTTTNAVMLAASLAYLWPFGHKLSVNFSDRQNHLLKITGTWCWSVFVLFWLDLRCCYCRFFPFIVLSRNEMWEKTSNRSCWLWW